MVSLVPGIITKVKYKQTYQKRILAELHPEFSPNVILGTMYQKAWLSNYGGEKSQLVYVPSKNQLNTVKYGNDKLFLPNPLCGAYPFAGVINGSGLITITIYEEDGVTHEFQQVGSGIGALEYPYDGGSINFSMTFQQQYSESLQYDLKTREASVLKDKGGTLGQFVRLTTGQCGLSNYVPVPTVLEAQTSIASTVTDYCTPSEFIASCEQADK